MKTIAPIRRAPIRIPVDAARAIEVVIEDAPHGFDLVVSGGDLDGDRFPCYRSKDLEKCVKDVRKMAGESIR